MPAEKELSRLEALRVAQGELCSGDTTGSVYVQLSPGAVLVQTDRSVALANVARAIMEAISREDSEPVESM